MAGLIASQVVIGLVNGMLYVLIAVGLSIIFGMLGIVNFAHGAFIAIGAYLAVTLAQNFGWPAVILAPLLTGVIGVIVEMTLIRHLYGKEPLLGLILTFALALFIEAALKFIFGGNARPFDPPGFLSGLIVWGPILLTTYRLAVLLITASVLIAFWAFLRFTRFGRIIRAGSRDAEMVGLLGINLPIVLSGVFGIGCLLAGVAGLLVGPLWSLQPSMGNDAIMPAFVIVTIGGLGSYLGATVAGLMVGLVGALTIQFAPGWSAASMYGLMMVVLLVRPRGLFGESWERFE